MVPWLQRQQADHSRDTSSQVLTRHHEENGCGDRVKQPGGQGMSLMAVTDKFFVLFVFFFQHLACQTVNYSCPLTFRSTSQPCIFPHTLPILVERSKGKLQREVEQRHDVCDSAVEML